MQDVEVLTFDERCPRSVHSRGDDGIEPCCQCPANRRRAGTRQADVLAVHERGRCDVVEVEPPVADLNTWLVSRGPSSFRQQLELKIGLRGHGLCRTGSSRSIA